MLQKRNKSKFFIACIMLAIISMVSKSMVFAKESSSSSVGSSKITDKVIYVSIYDEFLKTYLLNNTELYITEDFIVVDSLKKLKEAEIIQDYANFSDGTIASIIFVDDTYRAIDNGAVQRAAFYIKLNGVKVTHEQASRFAKNGDIVEFFYTNEQEWVKTDSNATSSSVQSEPETSDEKKSPVVSYWNADLVKKLNESSECLNRFGNDGIDYVTAMGIAGKTADIKAINGLANDIRKTTEYTSSSELAKRIVAATFCGFDASSSAYGQLLRQLYTYKDILNNGIYGALSALIAYDTNDYAVEATALNSRKAMVDELLVYQLEDGGFGLTKSSFSDIKTTSMAIIALSNYQSRKDVAEAITKAVNYLSALQLKSGGFSIQDKESCEGVATVIIALSSAGVDLEDERFAKKKNTLLESFMAYNTADGGFADVLGGKSDFVATQNAIIALTAIKKSANPYKLTTLVAQNETKNTSSAVATVKKAESTVVIGSSLIVVMCLAILVIVRRVIVIKKNQKQ